MASPHSLPRLALKLFFILHLASEYVGTVSSTSGPSMLPTLSISGDVIYTSKRYARGNGIEFGDLVEFKHPMVPAEVALKRIMGLPGDFVREDGGLGSGDRMIQVVSRGRYTQSVVPEGHCWLLGDNLEASRDSRTYGPLPMALIKGKATAKIWPLSSVGWLKSTLQRPEEG